MAMSLIRFDMRAPGFGKASPPELYDAAVEMAAWADEQGFTSIVLSEHHGTDDGFLPSPLALAGVMAGRTRRIPISISALLAPLYDPIKLAEDLAILDLASGGRVAVILGLGYRRSEYEAFGRDWDDRGALLDECIETLLKAWTGEPFAYRGRTVQVTPTPRTKPHPMLFVGGQSKRAARRAARFGLAFSPASNDAEMIELYKSECERLGVKNPLVVAPGDVDVVFVSEDPDRSWAEIGPHLLHDARTYAAWQPPNQRSAVHSDAESVEELRREGKYKILTPEECLERAEAKGALAHFLHFPLCGGTPPELAWVSLELFASKVLPALRV